MKGWIITALLIFFLNPAFSGQVRGKVTDNGNPVEFATVLVRSASDTTRVTAGAVTGADGSFVIGSLPSGSFLLQVRMVGYLTLTMPFSLEGADDNLNLGDLSLLQDAVKLNSVEVRATRELVRKTEQGLDRKSTRLNSSH